MAVNIDEWQLVEHVQDPKITEQCENTENETDSLSNCNLLPKSYRKRILVMIQINPTTAIQTKRKENILI